MGSSINLSDIAIKIPHADEEFHRSTVADLLHRQKLTFPGAQPVSFARHHLDELQARDYFMCEKTDGVRCLLYLTHIFGEHGEMTEAQFLIDRRNEYYFVKRDTLHIPSPKDFPAGFHVGTLLDGELVRQRFPNGKQRLAYLIFDLLAVDGEDVTNRPFDKRLARIDQLISKPLRELRKAYPQDVEAMVFQVEMKTMEFPYVTEMMFREKIPNLPHGNDGLIFTCKETPYVAGTDQHILKWKPPQENTIDFRLLLGAFPMLEDEQGEYEDWDAKPEVELHVNHGGRDGGYQFFAHLTITDAEWSAMKRMNQQFDGRIIECYMEKDVWRPKLDDGCPRFRDDKQDANHISVVESVLESIKDAVTEQDLIADAGRIRSAFKAREKARNEAAKKAEEERRSGEAMKQQQQQSRESAMQEEDDDGPKYHD